MAEVPTNTRTTYDAIGIREDLSNIIYNISPTDTPFMSGAGRDTCDNTVFEWQIDALADASGTNRVEEGWSPNAMAVVETKRVKNYTQISMKSVQSSGTAEAVDFAGRKSTQAYQLAKRSKELKRDMEKMLCDNVKYVVGATGTARATGGLGSWVGANYHSVGTAGSGHVGTACAGDGTDITTDATVKGPITEAAMKTVIKECYDSGGSPDTIMVGSAQKQVVSELASGAQTISPLRTDANKVAPAHVVASVEIYVSDFGNFKIIPNRFQRARDMWFLDFDYWALTYLRPFKTETLAKTGDSIQQMLVCEYGLKSKNQAASGLLADVA